MLLLKLLQYAEQRASLFVALLTEFCDGSVDTTSAPAYQTHYQSA